MLFIIKEKLEAPKNIKSLGRIFRFKIKIEGGQA